MTKVEKTAQQVEKISQKLLPMAFRAVLSGFSGASVVRELPQRAGQLTRLFPRVDTEI